MRPSLGCGRRVARVVRVYFVVLGRRAEMLDKGQIGARRAMARAGAGQSPDPLRTEPV